MAYQFSDTKTKTFRSGAAKLGDTMKVISFFKAYDLKVTRPALEEHKDAIINFLKSAHSKPHWETQKGALKKSE